MSEVKFFLDTQEGVDNLSRFLSAFEPCNVEVTFKEVKCVRTSKQQACIEIYSRGMAQQLNDGGLDMVSVFNQFEAASPWSQPLFKENIWRRLQVAMGLPASTTRLDTKQVNDVYMVVDKNMSERFGVSMAFPSIR